MLSANASMYSIMPSIFWLFIPVLLFFSYGRVLSILFRSLLPLLHARTELLQIFLSVWIQLSRAISAHHSVSRVSDIPLSCCSFPLSYSLSCHSVPATENLCYVSSICSAYRCRNYMSTVYILYFSTNFQPFLCLFTIFCLSFTFWNRKRLRSLFFPRSLSFFCFTPNHAPQGSPAWSSHSAPSLPFFSGRYTQWKAPTFPQSADESS